MRNEQIADIFSLLAKFMDLHGENSFKTKNYANAAFQIDKLPTQLTEMPANTWAGLKGIGANTAVRIKEIIETGTLKDLNELVEATPAGVIEMLQIKGLGAKKIRTIWKEMDIENMGELLYACNENRLILYKGFGEKTQQNVKDAIQFFMAQQGKFLYQQALEIHLELLMQLENILGKENVYTTGAIRRCDDTIDLLEYVVAGHTSEAINLLLQSGISVKATSESTVSCSLPGAPVITLHCCAARQVGITLLRSTGPTPFVLHVEELLKNAPDPVNFATEADVFEHLKLPFVEPPHRYVYLQTQFYNAFIKEPPATAATIKGIIHSHSTWSDGSHTPAQMAASAIEKGWEYLVLSDHSQAAAYAGGLRPERVLAQQAEIDALNKQLHPFRIFKSIECDILGNGDLDYEEEVLQSFDLVIASIHSTLRMSEEKAMQRLLKAIENPYTNILGHMTGRLLLSRDGYPLYHAMIIDACAANDVVIELNAHPRRLDIDFSWIPYALEKGVLISINPDAHNIEGFDDIEYGAIAASKALLPASRNLSSFSLQEFSDWLMRTRHMKGTLG